MRKRFLGGIAALSLLPLLPGVTARGGTADGELHVGSVYASVTATSVTLGNALVERTWDRASFRTTSLLDKRGTDHDWAGGEDFSLDIGGATVGSAALQATAVAWEELPTGIRLRIRLEAPGAAVVAERVAEVYNGVAGFRTQTVVTSLVPVAMTGAHLESVAGGSSVAATISSFRAGADWREPDWEGPPLTLGDPHGGTWRSTVTGEPGAAVAGAAQYLSLSDAADRRAFVELERNDLPSSRASYDGAVGSVLVDYSSDVVDLGPIEESGHAENPMAGDAPTGRVRALKPGAPFAFEPTFVGFGRDEDDEAWHLHKYLVSRMPSYEKDATFNSNGTDEGRISTGAKDDMDIAAVREIAPLARRMGIKTFILDDGWQAISGDWVPDSPGHTDPRGLYPPRFNDATFEEVRQVIAPMKLGLWMSPTFFNPASETMKAHPQWVCTPIGEGLTAANMADPDGGSNEAGLGAWGPDALPYVESRIDNAIDNWGVTYFKFDFLVWLDCAGQGDMYDFHDRFVAMLDRLQARHADVTFEIDETNDYRLFPFESVSRGPSWFQNGSPSPKQLLHNVWNLSPWVPAFSLGQHFLGDYRGVGDAAVDLRMAVSLLSHPTFFSDPRRYDGAVLDRASSWLAFRRAHVAAFTGVVYPLLDDPLAGGWTALQSWDPEAASGAVLAFRQGASSSSVTVPLHNVPAGRTFSLVRAPDGVVVGTATSEELAAGLAVSVDAPDGFQVLVIEPSG
jgi:hypothetical protein